VKVVNVGLPAFGAAVRAQGAQTLDVDWRIPAQGRLDLIQALTLLGGPLRNQVAAANVEAVRRITEGQPMLAGVARAADVVPGFADRTVLHCGPSIGWAGMCDPLRRSVRATVLSEGWAAAASDVDPMVERGEIRLAPANAHDTVLPMATTIGPSAPVVVVTNDAASTRAFSSINQGPGKAPWLGMDSEEAVSRLAVVRDAVAPVLDAALATSGPVDVWGFAAQGLLMGDDGHLRFQATTNVLWRYLLPYLVGLESPQLSTAAQFFSGNHLFFLNIAMAAAKSVLMAAYDVPGSTVVVGMSRNGTDFSVRLAGTPGLEFTAPAPEVGNALYHPGFGPGVSARDIGDSAVLELIGLGGAAAAASPAVAAFLGGSVRDAVRGSEEMRRICLASSRFSLPLLENRGSPVGVDAAAVVETGVTPAIHTGILHRSDGSGQVGAGVARAPFACFEAAVLEVARRLG
jgi:hypothetical protein